MLFKSLCFKTKANWETQFYIYIYFDLYYLMGNYMLFYLRWKRSNSIKILVGSTTLPNKSNCNCIKNIVYYELLMLFNSY